MNSRICPSYFFHYTHPPALPLLEPTPRETLIYLYQKAISLDVEVDKSEARLINSFPGKEIFGGSFLSKDSFPEGKNHPILLKGKSTDVQQRRKKDECYESSDGIRSRGDRQFLTCEGKTSKRFEL